ncbi:septal ring lytic transglycosylase RlpA family protein [Allopusillimonas ginsengisoli]|uniref:septal ring lytic transglycosylase RlpA family protein n=1 Tax=Allopusillimonas ginsengisoli TaxID=453575 RepID=UPI0039C1C5BC
MTLRRLFPALGLSLCLVILAGCAGSGTSGSGRSVTKSGGGYYKDDGPGDNIPANIAAIPDAVPKVETHRPANFRPYTVLGKRYVPVSDERPFRQTGHASWYGRKFHGQHTATGEKYDMYAMTAAHPTLPLPSYARVTRVANGRSVIVRINDRGPFHSSRIIDLSYVAAAKLGLIAPGSDKVVVEAITNEDIRNGNVPRARPIPPAMPTPTPTLVTDASPTSTLRINEASARPQRSHAASQTLGMSAPARIARQPHASASTGDAASAQAPDPLTQWLASRNSDLASATADTAEASTDRMAAASAPMTSTVSIPGTEPHVSMASASLSDTPTAASMLANSPEDSLGTTQHDDKSRQGAPLLYLQFGAFSAAQSADQLASKLNAQIAGIESRNATVQAGSSLYRVRIGPYSSRTAAVNAAVRIQQATGLTSTMASR